MGAFKELLTLIEKLQATVDGPTFQQVLALLVACMSLASAAPFDVFAIVQTATGAVGGITSGVGGLLSGKGLLGGLF